MKKFLAFWSLCLCAIAAVAQTQSYVPVDITTWTATDVNDATKDVVIRHNKNTAYYVVAGETQLTLSNASTEPTRFRLIKEGDKYRIYCPTKNQYISRTTTAKNASITGYSTTATEETLWVIVNNNNNDYSGAYDIITGNNAGYVANGSSWNTHGGIGNKNIGGWDASDGNSEWQICKISTDPVLDEFNNALTMAKNMVQNFSNNSSAKLIFTEEKVNTALTSLTALGALSDEEKKARTQTAIQQILVTLYSSVANKQVYIKNPTRSNGYLKMSLDSRFDALATTSDVQAAFFLNGGGTDTNLPYLQIGHVASNRYIPKTGAASVPLVSVDQANAGLFALRAFGTEEVAFISLSPGDFTHNSLHITGGADKKLVAWEAVNVGGSTFKIEAANFDQSAILTAAQQRYNDSKRYREIGTSLGQYAQGTGYADYAAAENSNDITALGLAVHNKYNGSVTGTLNMPIAGKFFRIKSTSATTDDAQKYVSNNISNNRLTLVAATTPLSTNTLFCMGENNKLVAYADGKTVGLNATPYGHATTVNYNATNVATTTFSASSSVGLYNWRMNNGTDRSIFVKHDKTTVDAGGGNVDNAPGYRVKLEEVTELPLTLNAKGFATFHAPAAIQVPEGVKVYIGAPNADNTRIALTQVGNKIPANQAVILYKEGVTQRTDITLNVIASTEADASAFTGNAFTGVAVSTVNSGENTYVLKRDANTFVKLANNAPKRAFRAFVTLTASSPVQALDFSFDDVVTAIENAIVEKSETPVYDLSGRRVTQRISGGVYLQNGKKFVQP